MSDDFGTFTPNLMGFGEKRHRNWRSSFRRWYENFAIL